MVMITGSKFAGGPPFAGAILLPPAIVTQLERIELPLGLLSHTSAEDWSADLRAKIDCQFWANENLGAGLRWEAALVELERFFALPVELRETVVKEFAMAVQERVQESAGLELIDLQSLESTQTIFPIMTMLGDDKIRASEAVHRLLKHPFPENSRDGISRRAFHVGQPVPIGTGSALRVCLGMPHVVDVAESVAKGQVFGSAIAPLMADLDGLFLKWTRIANDLRRS